MNAKSSINLIDKVAKLTKTWSKSIGYSDKYIYAQSNNTKVYIKHSFTNYPKAECYLLPDDNFITTFFDNHIPDNAILINSIIKKAISIYKKSPTDPFIPTRDAILVYNNFIYNINGNYIIFDKVPIKNKLYFPFFLLSILTLFPTDLLYFYEDDYNYTIRSANIFAEIDKENIDSSSFNIAYDIIISYLDKMKGSLTFVSFDPNAISLIRKNNKNLPVKFNLHTRKAVVGESECGIHVSQAEVINSYANVIFTCYRDSDAILGINMEVLKHLSYFYANDNYCACSRITI